MKEESEWSFPHSSTTNFTSEFFGNFISNSEADSSRSQLENSISRSHRNSSMNTSQQQQDFSVDDDKIRQFHAQNLVYLAQTIAKRVMIDRWRGRTQSLKRLQSRTPNHLTKVFLKIFYSLSVKLQMKYSMVWRKLLKNSQEGKKQVDSQHVVGQKEKRRDGLEKLCNIQRKLYDKYCQMRGLKQAMAAIVEYGQRRMALENIDQIWESAIQRSILIGWRALRGWLNYLQKVQILEGTLSLLIHRLTRDSLLALNLQRPSLECNDISNIQQTKSRKESFKMNNSSQTIALQRQFLESCRIAELKAAQQTQPDTVTLKKKESLIDRNDPRLLKFTKDVKRKTAPVCSQQQFQDQCQSEPQEPFQLSPQAPIANEVSIFKPAEEFSMLRRASVTMNTSMAQSRSFLKKMFYPIDLTLDKAPSIRTGLTDDSLPLILNEGKTSKQFCNSHRATKARALKHEEFKKQFTDFNDLFCVREIIAFYQSTKTAEESKKVISLAKIKEKVNTRTQEQYYSRKFVTLPSEQKGLERVGSQPNIDLSGRSGRQKKEHPSNSIEMSSSQARKSKERRMQFRIPSQLPKNFDYYVDKSGRLEEQQRQTSRSKSRKKIQFNVVKAGSLHTSGQRQIRKLKSVEIQIKTPTLKPKLELNLKKRSSDKIVVETRSPRNNEYCMSFRDPPKKKIKKVLG